MKRIVEIQEPVKVEVYECDACKKSERHAPASYVTTSLAARDYSYGDPPNNWIVVAQQPRLSHAEPWHFCSWKCVSDFALRSPRYS